MKSKFLSIIILVSICVIWVSCAERDKHGQLMDTPTSGEITIAVDESLKPLVQAEVDAFEAIYQQAHVHVRYMSESEAVDALLKDSVRLAVVTRKLADDEVAQLMNEHIVPSQADVAKGAVALIINKHNPDSLLRLDQLREILEGKISNWNQIHSSTASSPIEVVFDNPTSGIVRLLQDSVVNVTSLPANCFAVNNNQAVVDYVTQKPNAIGLIGVEWISDHDDSTANRFMNAVSVISLSRDSMYFKPYQAYMALNQYPLTRSTIVISREARAGLGSGFIAFVASDKGQRIVLKAGLVPVTMPVRIVEVNHESFNN